MKTKSLLSGVIAAVIPFAAALAATDLNDLADLKPLIMRAYGVRNAVAESDTTIRVFFGSSHIDSRRSAESYRIISDDDADYAYEKFVRPSDAKGSKDEVEFAKPAGAWMPNKADMPLYKADALLTLPTPLKKGCHYAVLAQGEGSAQVTSGTCAFKFTYGAKDPAWDMEPITDEMAARLMGLRRVSAIGDGKILCEFGHSYNEANGKKLGNWKVTVNGKPVFVQAIGRRSKLECYNPTGWGGQFGVFMYNNVFLDLGRELKDGDRISVEVGPAITSANGKADFTFTLNKSVTRSIKTNQIGYLPGDLKIAYLGQWLGSFPEAGTLAADAKPDAPVVFSTDAYFAECGNGTQEERALAKEAEAKARAEAEQAALEAALAAGGDVYDYDNLAPYALRFREVPDFTLRDAASGAVVYTGKAKFTHNGYNDDYMGNMSAENVYVLDFTEFKKPGRYFIAIDGVGRSLEFRIDKDVYQTAFAKQAQGMYGQRCGCELDPKLTGGWRRISCHDKGITTTSVLKHLGNAHGSPFRQNMDMDPNPAYPPIKAARDKVEADPSQKPLTFRTFGNMKKVPDDRFGFAYMTGEGDDNGLEADYKVDPAKGCTLSFFTKRVDSYGANKWFGDFLRFAALKLGVSWGDIYGFGRINWQGSPWHHVVVRISPADEKGIAKCEVIFNGKPADRLPKSVDLNKAEPVIGFGFINNDSAEGTYYAGIRLFERGLTDKELADLTATVPAEIPHVIQGIGGHHDAGDYNPRSHIDVAQSLLNAYEMRPKNFTDGQLPIPEHGNGIPDIVDEAMWAVKIWEYLQCEDGSVYDGTESAGDPNLIQTVELDPCGDFTFAKDTKGAYLAAGIFAQSSRIMASLGKKDRAAELLTRARKAYDWGVKHHTEPMKSLGVWGEYHVALRAYAAAQLYHTTWDKKYNDDFIKFTPWREKPNAEVECYGYFDLRLAAYAYALIPREKADPAVWDAVKAAIVKHADMYIRGSERMGYKFIIHPYAPITWGTGAYQNYAVEPAFAWYLTGDKHYREWLIRSCDNTLGDNPLGISYITGAGQRTIRCPLHNSRYRADGVAADGIQGQGPNMHGVGYSYNDTAYPWHRQGFGHLQELADVHFCIAMDEPTANNMANTMMIFGLLCAGE